MLPSKVSGFGYTTFLVPYMLNPKPNRVIADIELAGSISLVATTFTTSRHNLQTSALPSP